MKKLFGFRLILFFVVAITMSFFGVEEAQAYYLINSHKNVSFTTSNFSDLGISLDRESSYPSGNNSSTVRLTITNPNNYAVSYNLGFSNSNISYMIDGALGATYTVNARSSKTNVIEITGATGSSITITVSSVLPYRKQFTKVVTFDNSNPTTSITFNSSTQTLTLSMSDTAGLDSYYFGTSENPNNNAFVDLNDVTSTSVNTTVSAAGRYYLITRDSNGNESKEYVDFYRIDFSVLNQTISPTYLIGKSGDSITLPTPTANTGYTNEGHWFTNSAMTTGSKAYGASYTVSGSATLYTSAPANPLVFNGQTINKTYNPSSSQTFTITTATNGTGSYAYSEVSEQNSGVDTNYITLSGTTATIAAGTPAGTYTYVVNALDNNSASTANATYTVVIDKKQATISNLAASKTITYPTTDSMTFKYDGDGTVSCTSSDTTKVTCRITGSGTNKSLRLTPVGVTSAPVAVTVSATAGTNYSAATSVATSVTVNPGTLELTIENIIGTMEYGSSVSGTGVVTSGSATTTYQWYYSDVEGATSGGTAIEGATRLFYKIGPGLVGKYLYLVATATEENYIPATYVIAANDAITTKSVTPSVTSCTNKTYDGSATITCSLDVSPKVSGDSLTVSGTCAASDAIVGVAKTVTCSNITISGDHVADYALDNTTATKEEAVNITTKSVTPSVTSCTDRAYNGSTSVTCSLSTPTGISGETLATSGTCTVANATAGNNKTVTCSGIQIGGSYASNYTLSSTSASGAVSITKAPLTVTADDKSKIYGSSTPSFTSTITGFVNSETTSVLGGTISYAVTNNGTPVTVNNSLPVGTYTITPSGLTSSNYEISYVSGTLTVNKKQATISNLDASKTLTYPNTETMSFSYDGDGTVSCTSSDITKVTCSSIITVSGRALSLTALDLTSSPVTVTVSATEGTNYSAVEATTAVTVNPGQVEIRINSMKGTPQYNEYVYIGGTSSTSGIEKTYQWYYTDVAGATSGGTAIEGATSSQYTVGHGLVGKYLYVVMSGTKENYLPGSDSAAVEGVVTAKPVTPSVTSCTDRAYNGSTSVTCSLKTSTGISGETLTTSGTCTVANANAGSDKEVTCNGITISGTYVSDYTLSSTSASGTVSITKAPLTVTADNKSMTHGDSAPSYTYTASGFVNSETTSVLGGTISYAVTNNGSPVAVNSSLPVGTYTITPSGLTSSNYTITFNTGTLTVAAKSVTPSVTSCTDRAYNGSTSVTCSLSTPTGVSGETLTTSGTCTVANATAGDNKTVTCSGIQISGSYASNYTLSSTSASGTVSITKAPLTVTADNKSMTYGSSAPAFTSTVTGFVNSETTSVLGGTLTHTIKNGNITINVGTTTSVGSYTIIPSGYTSSNYTISYVNGTLTINKKQATISNLAASKTITYPTTDSMTFKYDGDGTLSCASSDTTKVTCEITGSGTNRTLRLTPKGVTSTPVTVTISASAGNNYSAATSVTTSVTVNPGIIPLSVLINTDPVYNSTVYTTTSSLSGAEETYQWYYTDVAGATSGGTAIEGATEPSYTVGHGLVGKYLYIVVTASLENYTPATASAAASAAVAAREVNPNISSCTNKVYDGTALVTCSFGLVNKKGLDSLTATGTCNASDANVGAGKTVTCTNLTLGGTHVADYVLSGTTVTKEEAVDITVKPITPTITSCTDRAYNGSTSVTCSLSTPTGVSGETVTPSGACTVASATAGNNKAVTCSNITISGATASNYALSSTSANSTINITKVALTVTADNKSMTYGDSAPSYTYTASGFVNSETTSVLGGTISYAVTDNGTPVTVNSSLPVGTYTITPSGLTSSNYTITFNTGTLTVTAKTVTPSITSCTNKTYDGSATVTCSLSLSSVVSGDSITTSGTCNASDANAGTGKTVTCSDLILDGTHAADYVLSRTTVTKAGAVDIAPATLSGSVLISGTNTYGETLTAAVTNTDGATLSYQWYYTDTPGATSGGTAINGQYAAALVKGASGTMDVADATRYVGPSVDNYVSFNNGELWRIIGAYGDNIKIIRANSVGSRNMSASQFFSSWTGSSIYSYLNQTTSGGYYYSLSQTAKDMIVSGTWLMGASSTSAAASNAYTHAQTVSYSAKVGLVASYEYLYAASSGCHTVNGSNFTTCSNSDWLKPASSAWTLTKNNASTSSNTLFLYIAGMGYISSGSYQASSNVHPVVYLNSNVKIVGGSGIDTDPYILSQDTSTPASGSTYEVGPGLTGKYLYVEVTATKDNYTTAKWTAATTTANNTTQAVATRPITIHAKNQTIEYSDSISTATTQVEVTSGSLVGSDAITSITLTPSTTSVTNSGRITPSAAVIEKGTTDVTSNYSITYTAGTLVITKAQASIIGFGSSTALSTVNPSGVMIIPARYTGDGTLSCTSSDSTIATCEVRYQTGDAYYIYIYPQSSPATGYYTATITLSSSGETNYESATPQSEEIHVSRNVFGVTLDNNGATTAGTTTIYEKYDVGWYTDSTATTTMSSITPPTKNGYRFGGYYTGQNGTGTLMIDASGNIVGSPATFSESPFVIYAKWDQIYAENLSFNNTITGFNCTQSQCAIDKLAALLR